MTSLVDGEEAPPPRPPSPVFAKILRIFGRKNCNETIFAAGNPIFQSKNRPVPTVHAAGHDWNPLELSCFFGGQNESERAIRSLSLKPLINPTTAEIS